MDYKTNPLMFLDYVQFYPTLQCNMSCGFCFNQKIGYALQDITSKSFRVMIDKLKFETPVRTLDIMGGEPFLHDELTDIIEYALTEGFRLNISTNGTMKEKLLEILQIYRDVKTGISVNNLKQLLILYDVICAFKPIVKSLYIKNMNKRMVEILGSLNIEYYLIYPDELNPLKRDGMIGFERFYNFIRSTENVFFTEPVYCSGFLPDLNRYPILDHLRCPAGTVKIGVLPNGDVYPCNLFFGYREFCLGNILREPLENILGHPVLDFFRRYEKNLCPKKDCSLHNKCHGGCPAHAYAHFNGLDAPEPRCLYDN